ncbi:CRISPR-associated helicase Cas3 [Thermotomaculum hydrothermale]|uniref:CRISPR-associated helicase Cas3 n=1 Tax=Thermotomaculum hydrothermale TaxID=981385 RepID=A0A7R6SYF5_9BACT|nr:CRISPR-associated helicase Cas3' [Thermotomaculum hydrothermale]BBB31815.1 CRISPR-associated helicase Cas3 [Thermotomaculum hydrothermale]
MDRIVFYSHRDPLVKLKDHLRDVSARAKKIYKSQKDFVKLQINQKIIENVCVAHDFGKYTTFFQNYIIKKIRDKKNRHFHGFISALFGAWLCKNKDYIPLIAYFVIKHHHGDLRNFEDDLNEGKNVENFQIFKEQIKDIRKNQKIIEKEYGFSIEEFLNEYENVFKTLQDLSFKLFECENQETRIEVYFTILYLYSLLIDSDKKSAAKVDEFKRKSIPKDILERYRKIKNWDNPEKRIDKLRNKLYYEIKRKIENLKEIPNISTITAPTGLGKTFLNLEVALNYRDKLKQKPRIIYSLPFVSIIDQTYKFYDEILTRTLRKEYLNNQNVYLLQHHHLADTKYKGEREEKPVSESLLLTESWDSEIILTTFVQFLHSVIAFKNSFLKKFHNIAGSIIILDEVQAVDIGYWKAIGIVLKKLSELLGCKIIFSTATKPLIIDEYIEMVENQDEYFKSPVLKRTKLIPKIEETKTIDEFTDYFLKNLDNTINSYLVVFNTIKSSIEFFEKIKNLNKKNYIICYLSTNIIPLQRKVRIKKISNMLKRNEKLIVVSTQVIEAGVDLDFQKVYRDMAPLDSIIQVAGRCNRNNKIELGDVEIHRLYDLNMNREFSKMIYGSTTLSLSGKILRNEYTEDNYINLINKYFSGIQKNESFEKSDRVLKGIEKLKFYGENNCIANDFKVIEELPIYQDLFIEINNTAKRIYEKFEKEIIEEKDFIKRLENYHKLKVKFKKYIISVPKDFLKYAINIEIFPKIPLENLEDYYDKDGYGFKRTKEEDVLIW